jgi:hypothetical protein
MSRDEDNRLRSDAEVERVSGRASRRASDLLIVLAEPLDVLGGTPVSLIELIPPVHQRVYRMGLEHLGVVVGDDIDDFSRVHPR